MNMNPINVKLAGWVGWGGGTGGVKRKLY